MTPEQQKELVQAINNLTKATKNKNEILESIDRSLKVIAHHMKVS
jgi:hypothetical protein